MGIAATGRRWFQKRLRNYLDRTSKHHGKHLNSRRPAILSGAGASPVDSLEERLLYSATLYWDTNGATAGLGGTGTWDTTTANWTTDATGASATQAWDNSGTATAIFGGTAATVTISGTMSAATIEFDVDTYTIQSGTLSLPSGDTTVDVQTDGATISSIIAGTHSLSKIGGGTLTLSGANTYTGATAINAGVLSVLSLANGGSASNIGQSTNAAANLVLGGGTLRYTGGTASTNRAFTLTAGTTSAIEVGSGANLTISGAGANTTGGLTKTGAGTLTLSGASTFTGATTVNAGALAYGVSNALGSGAVTVDGSTAVLDVKTFSDSVGAVTLDNGGQISGTTGVLTSTATYAMKSGSVGAILAGSSGLTKTTSGTVTLSGVDTYTGTTTVNAGTLAYGASNAIASGAVTVDGSTAVLDISSYGDTVGTLTLDNGAQINGTSGVLTSTVNYALKSGSVSAILAGSVGLIKTTSGTVTLSGTNTYTGANTISGGTLSVSSLANGGSASGIGQSSNAAANLVLSGGTLQYTGGSITIDRKMSLSTGVTGILDVASGSSLTMTGGVPFTTASFEKRGAGALTISGAMVYGATTVSGGTLRLGASNLLPDGGPVTVASGATFDLNGYSEAVGPLSGSGDVALGAGTLTSGWANISTSYSGVISGSGGVTKSGTGTWTLSGASTYTGATTISAGTLSVSSLANGGSNSNIGASTNAAANLSIGAGTLLYTGSDTTIDRNFTTTSSFATISVDSGVNLAMSGAGAATAGALTKTGAGTLTLSGANAYTGYTTITAGTLAYGASNVIATGGVNINGSTAVLDIGSYSDTIGQFLLTNGQVNGTTGVLGSTTNHAFYSGTINANLSGAFNKTTSGTVTITAATSLSGFSNLVAGTLAYGTNDALGTTALNINGSTAVLDIGSYTDSVGSVTVDGGAQITGTTGVLTSAGSYNFKSGSVSAILAGSGNATKSTSGTVTLSAANTYTGTTTVSDGTLAYGINNALYTGAVTINGAAAVLALGSYSDSVGTVTLDGGGQINSSTGVLTSSATYALKSGSVSAILAGSVGLTKSTSGTVTLSGANTYTGVTTVSAGVLSVSSLANGGSASNIGQSTNAASNLVLGGGTLQYTGSTVSTDRNFTLTAATTSTLDVGSGTMLTISGASTTTTGALTKAGAGTLTLSGANTYTGATTISNGTLKEGTSSALPTAAAVTISSGAIFDLNNYNVTIGSLAGAGGVALGSGPLTVNGSTSTSYSGVIDGSGSLTKSGSGTLTLSGLSTYTGATTITGGTLSTSSLANGGTASNIGQSTNAASKLVFSGGTLQYTGSSVSIDRNYTLTSSYWGTIDIASGSSLAILGSNTSTTGALSKIGSGTLVLNNAYTLSQFSLTGGLLKIGSSPATFSVNNYIGGSSTFDINGHNVALGSVVGNSPALITNNGGNDAELTLVAGSVGYGGYISTAIQDGTSKLSLRIQAYAYLYSTSNSYSGVTTIENNSPLSASAANALSSNSAVSISAGSILNLNGYDNVIAALAGSGTVSNSATGTTRTLTVGNSTNTTFFGTIVNGGTGSTGVVALTKIGSGTLTLSGTNTYTGATAINAGTLEVDGSTLSSGTIAANSTGRLTGTGSVGAVTVASGGSVAPGSAGPGVLSTRNVTLNSGSSFVGEINGSTAGAGYDQLNVTGTVSLGGATLSLSGTRAQHGGDAIVLIKNDGTDAVTGTFGGLSEGSLLVVGGTRYKITYAYNEATGTAGTGNDVALIDVPLMVTAAPALGTISATTPVRVATIVDSSGNTTDASIYGAVIDWGDGTTSAGTITANGAGGFDVTGAHGYTAAGPFHVSTAVSDTAGAAPPAAGTTAGIVDVGTPANLSLNVSSSSIQMQGSLTVSGSFYDGVTQTREVWVDWGDGPSGSPNLTNVNLPAGSSTFTVPSHTYNDSGSYTVSAVVKNNGTVIGTKTASVAVVNVVPSDLAVRLSSSTPEEGAPMSVSGTFSDIGSAETHHVSIDWGDGTTATTLDLAAGVLAIPARTHTYLNDGNYNVVTTVTDAHSATVNTTVVAAVQDVPPSYLALSLTGSGLDITVSSGTFLDPGVSDAHMVTVNWGDGTTNTTVSLAAGVLSFSTGAHSYATNGTYSITATVADGSATTTTTAQVIPIIYHVSSVDSFSATLDDSLPSGSPSYVQTLSMTSSGFSVGGNGWSTDLRSLAKQAITGSVAESGTWGNGTTSPFSGTYTFSNPGPTDARFDVGLPAQILADHAGFSRSSTFGAGQEMIAYDAAGYGGFADHDYNDGYANVNSDKKALWAAATVKSMVTPGEVVSLQLNMPAPLPSSSASPGWRLRILATEDGRASFSGLSFTTDPADSHYMVTGWQDLGSTTKNITGSTTGATGDVQISLEVSADRNTPSAPKVSSSAAITVVAFELKGIDHVATGNFVTTSGTSPQTLYVTRNSAGHAFVDVAGVFSPAVSLGNAALWSASDSLGSMSGTLSSGGSAIDFFGPNTLSPTTYDITAWLDQNHNGALDSGELTRSVHVVAGIDFDADTDNNNPAGVPGNTLAEDRLEDSAPGKYIALSLAPGSSSQTAYRYVPVDIHFPAGLSLSTAVLSFNTNASLNVWKKDGTASRTSGDKLSSTVYSLSSLGVSGSATSLRLYIEAIKAGASTLTFNLYPTGAGSGATLTDSVQFTVLDSHVATCSCASGNVDPSGGVQLSLNGFTGGHAYLGGVMGANGSVSANNVPRLVLAGNAVAIMQDSQVRIYDAVGGGFTPRVADQGTLSAGGSGFIETDPAGYRWEFAGSGANVGQLVGVTDPAGNKTSYTIDEQGRVVLISWEDGHNNETIPLTYGADGRLVHADLYQNGVGLVRSMDVGFYGASDARGGSGDVKSLSIKNASGVSIDTQNFIYYKAGDTGGAAHAVKYMLSNESYERLAEATSDPDTAADSVVAQYADQAYQYDSQGRVTNKVTQGEGCSTCSGGLGSSTYTYTDSTFASGYNSWANKITQTLPGYNFADPTDPENTTVTTYYNFAGQTMLEVTEQVATGDKWYSFTEYDSSGHAILTAGTSAVTGFDDTYADLLHKVSGNYAYLADSDGLLQYTDYYASTTATTSAAGGVVGYVQDQKISHGETATKIPQDTTDYIASPGGTTFPVNSSTVYSDTAGAVARTTTYTYTWSTDVAHPDQMVSQTVSNPVVTTAQNGPNAADESATVYDSFGRPTWTRDADGFLSYTAYDPLTGAAIKTITDVDTSRTSEFTALPSGWATPTGGGLHLITTMEFDSLGRTTRVTDPNGAVSFTVYNDADHETRTYSGAMVSDSFVAFGPTQVSRQDLAGSYSESLTMSATPSLTDGVPDGSEAISDIQSLSRTYTSIGGQVTSNRSYFHIPTAGYSTAASLGAAGTDYLETTYSYDHRGRQSRVEDPDGTIHRTIYDVMGRVVSTWIGTDDMPTSGYWSPTNNGGANMLQVSANVYDGGGPGDGNLTESSAIADGSTSYATDYQYDFRNRMTDSRGPDNVATHMVYDNLGETTLVQTYADVDADFVIDSTELRGQSETAYDNQGRAFQSTAYQVDPVTGSVGNSLTSNTWFNHRGMQVKTLSPSGLISKTLYDGAGRATLSAMSIDAAETTYADALTLTGDTVIQQSNTLYDKARPVASLAFQRFGDDTSTTGPLNGGNSYRSESVTWYDAAGRPTNSASLGTDPGHLLLDSSGAIVDTNTDGVADLIAGSPLAPNTSDNYIASATAYDAAGRAYRTTDNLGHVTQTSFDLLGRTVAVIANYIDGVALETESDTDQTTQYIYDTAGRLSKQRALDPKGSGNGVQNQDTTYLYESAISGSLVTNTIYPDSTDTTSSGTDQVKVTYDRLGRQLTMTDQRGVAHAYGYDSAGRMATDAVTNTPTGVDDSVLRIQRGYDDMGRLQLLTSYDSDTAGAVVNQVKWTYDGYGNVVKTQQEHYGAVTTGSPAVLYSYDDGASSGVAHFVRLSSVTDPAGRVVYYNYPTSGIGAALSRLDNIAADSSGTTQYLHLAYLGAGTLVTETHPSVTGGLTLSYDPAGDHSFTGWDRFGRVVDQKWTNTAGTALDEYQYTYDRNSNRVSRINVLHSALDEAYTYDGLDRLTDTNRNSADYQSWTLDVLGNWAGFDNQGTTQTRTADAANQIGSITASSGPTPVTPVYDAAGNMTLAPSGNDPSVPLHLKYDAWNRLVEVRADSSGSPGAVIATYVYDGRNYRTAKTVGSNPTQDFYYNESWQLLETRSAGVAHGLEKYLYDPRYIDAPVLRFYDANTDGDLADAGDTTLYYTQDANFNTTALIDQSTGDVAERYSYDPYGNTTVYDASWSVLTTGSAVDNAIMYAGYHADAETGFDLARNRYYDAVLGVWVSRDPMIYIDGYNEYQLDRGSPINGIDPSGLALFAFDGTSNYTNPNTSDRASSDTNVAKMYQNYTGDNRYYYGGVGNSSEHPWYTPSRLFGLSSGLGSDDYIKTAFENLVSSYNSGDKIIDIIGFSRGSAEALEFLNRISDGIPDKKHPGLIFCNVKVRFVGLFDTVTSYGVDAELTSRNDGAPVSVSGKRTGIPTAGVVIQRISHAIARDENRSQFPWHYIIGANQTIFPGVHADIGGGYPEDGVSNIPLKWMIKQGREVGVPFKPGYEDHLRINPNEFHDSQTWYYWTLGVGESPRIFPNDIPRAQWDGN
jgi:RHS repeat-associated protein